MVAGYLTATETSKRVNSILRWDYAVMHCVCEAIDLSTNIAQTSCCRGYLPKSPHLPCLATPTLNKCAGAQLLTAVAISVVHARYNVYRDVVRHLILNLYVLFCFFKSMLL